MKIITRQSRKGFVLIFALLITSISLLLLIPYASRVLADLKLTSIINNSTLALNLAEAGVERALWEMAWNDNTFSGFTSTPSYTSGILTGYTYSILVNSFQDSTNKIVGDYDISAWVSLDEKSATVTGTGYVPNRAHYEAKRTIKATYVKNNFNRAIGACGTDGITLGKNSKVDSYTSDNGGTYATTQANSDGDIATNGPINIPNNTYVYGNANPGKDYPFSSQPVGVTGSWGTLQAPLVYDPIPAETLSAERASGLAALGHGVITESESGSYTRTGDNLVVDKTVTLTGGSYYFKSITVNNGGNIIVNGQSTIYVDEGNVLVDKQGDLNVSAQTTFYVAGGDITIETQGDINTLGVPKNLTIYSTGTTITLITQTDFFGAIYAPNAAISLTAKTAGGEMYGAIACNSFVSGTNTAVHFDKALLKESPLFLNSRVTSWQETQ